MKRKKAEKMVQDILIEAAAKEDIEKGFKIKKGAIVDVEWCDEADEMPCRACAVGKVFGIDDKMLCLATMIKAEKVDLVFVPVKAIEQIRVIIE